MAAPIPHPAPAPPGPQVVPNVAARRGAMVEISFCSAGPVIVSRVETKAAFTPSSSDSGPPEAKTSRQAARMLGRSGSKPASTASRRIARRIRVIVTGSSASEVAIPSPADSPAGHGSGQVASMAHIRRTGDLASSGMGGAKSLSRHAFDLIAQRSRQLGHLPFKPAAEFVENGHHRPLARL